MLPLTNTARRNKAAGQALVEYLLVLPLLFLSFGLVVEVANLCAYKYLLFSSAAEVAVQLALHELPLRRNGDLTQNSNSASDASPQILKHLEQQVAQYFTSHPLHNFKSDRQSSKEENAVRVNVQIDRIPHSLGVTVEIFMCVSPLFVKLSTNPEGNHSISNHLMLRQRDCLGRYLPTENPVAAIQFRLREVAFAPWPASTNLFWHGQGMPTHFVGTETQPQNQLAPLMQANSNELLSLLSGNPTSGELP